MTAHTLSEKFVPGRPPDRGAFPLDHFGECAEFQKKYMRCLKENKYDNMSCRYLSKQYLQCRMENNLMAHSTLENLGFKPDENEPKPPRKDDTPRKEQTGYVPGVTEPIYVPSMKKRLRLDIFFPDKKDPDAPPDWHHLVPEREKEKQREKEKEKTETQGNRSV
uniref:Cytochrome c oxidase assembly protein COX19 n=1 Tax=Chromera velia CCMP2878 TaxID=1169474 RepID=A0A0G4HPB5_9ALVE|mmetsp:Transcript_559/g.1240  ORF Transcript_559/g.1240 Transcript_559/m.1240 type:complete len:164 (+) Transcript_559:199-690(+)|eukprot:Cvel_29733.t1-p1 / transcript=Cvel_29733.t1 / gene=Cvel_29733 / organism=Chromera_velia_CCMP2878 / gene_product=Cytochrome c oxidase assembly protein COX19, putative / transcript_product=Cytochrome c oxidase assembly protein COX19, putative / location=Cvel_scaffold4126:5597-7109(+) / protein_length=163 / sequence_SO=supercontig / SO=protein_coding / is_pseudo=false